MGSIVPIPVPETLEAVGIRRILLEDLALKTLYLEGELSLIELGERTRLSLAVVEEIFQRLRKAQLCEVKGMDRGVHRIDTTSQGKARALELLSLNQYVGPAPVSLEEYTKQIKEQSVNDVTVHAPDLERALQHLVLYSEILTHLGTAIVSGRSIILHGPPGTGKTIIAEALPSVYPDQVWVPHAVEVGGQIITVYDSATHETIDDPLRNENDARWVLCRRPRVLVGGELTIDMLDLQFNATTKFYAAPLQMKANNGVFIVDDFGRQRVNPEELLNRWIVPLDRRIDFLTLAGGKKFEIPFDVLVVFATNLNPSALADEAFLRRIQSKVKVDYVSREHFHEIFRRVCRDFQLEYSEDLVDNLIQLLGKLDQQLRACYPKDIAQHVCWEARYAGKPPELNWISIEQACRNYFMAFQEEAALGLRT